jgi:hypothetical protein
VQDIVNRVSVEELAQVHQVHLRDKSVVEVSARACREYFSRWLHPQHSNSQNEDQDGLHAGEVDDPSKSDHVKHVFASSDHVYAVT